MRAILANPRYTGFEIWNKQRKDEVLVDVDDVALGHQSKMRWNDTSEWIWSPEPMHKPIVTRNSTPPRPCSRLRSGVHPANLPKGTTTCSAA